MRILRELIWGLALSPLSWNLRMPLALMARRLSADEGTVRNRVRAFHSSGFIREWRTILNPSLVGAHELAVWFDLADDVDPDGVLEAARLLPGVILINRFHGGGLTVILRQRDETVARRTADLFLRLVRPQWCVLAWVPFPPCTLPLRSADRAVLRSLLNDPRKPAVEVARELGVTTRTVRRRLDRMIRHRAVFALPRLDPKVVKGSLMAGLFVTYPPDRKREIDDALTAELDEFLWHVFHMMPVTVGGFQPCLYNLLLPNLAKGRELLRKAHDLPGVARCSLRLYEDVETFYEPFEGDLDRLQVLG